MFTKYLELFYKWRKSAFNSSEWKIILLNGPFLAPIQMQINVLCPGLLTGPKMNLDQSKKCWFWNSINQSKTPLVVAVVRVCSQKDDWIIQWGFLRVNFIPKTTVLSSKFIIWDIKYTCASLSTSFLRDHSYITSAKGLDRFRPWIMDIYIGQKITKPPKWLAFWAGL